jgi:hypothetical protein
VHHRLYALNIHGYMALPVLTSNRLDVLALDADHINETRPTAVRHLLVVTSRRVAIRLPNFDAPLFWL